MLANLRTLLSNDSSNDDRCAGKGCGDSTLKRFLATPALVGGHFFGLVIVADADHDYTKRDKTVIETLAALYAVAVQRKRQENEIRKDEQRWRLILDSVSAGIIIVDEETYTIVEANPMAVATIGLPRDEIVGPPLLELCLPGHERRLSVGEQKKTRLTKPNAPCSPLLETRCPYSRPSCLLM